MLAVVTGDDDRQLEPDALDARAQPLHPLPGLFPGQRDHLVHAMPGDLVGEQLIGQREVALVPDDEVVQLDDLARGTHRDGHENTASASISSIAAMPRSIRHRHSSRARAGSSSQPRTAITGKSRKNATANR